MSSLRPPSPAAMSGNLRGILWMLLSTFCFAALHGAVRHVSATVHPFEIAFFRNLFGALVILPWLVRFGWAPLRTRRLGLHGLRALLNAIAMMAFFTALSLAPLVEVTALGFTAPIFGTVLAVLFFGERVGIRRWSATLVGFAGTLVVLRPGFTEVGTGLLLALLGALVWAGVMMIVKSLGRTDSSITITGYMSVLMTPLSLVPALWVWQWPTGAELAWLVAIGLLGGVGQLMLAQSLKEGEANVVMPIDYFKLIWTTAIAWLAFAELPDPFTYAGATMIFASSIYIAYRERRTGTPLALPRPRGDIA